MEDTMVSIEAVLAAYIDSQGGVIKIPANYAEKSYEDFALALDYDFKANDLTITLVRKEDVEYEDE